jgi:hypothetical protein
MRIKRGVLLTAIIFFLAQLFLFANVSAQINNNNTVSGTVISKETGAPLDHITILWSNKGIGSISNAEGKFVMVLTPPYIQQDSLLFSCLGYKPQKISVQATITNKNLIVKLDTAIEDLQEVSIKPLTLKQLLDSVARHNQTVFISPIKLSGYYREFVYTNAACNEYADALCEYFFDGNSKGGSQLKINASRCIDKKGYDGDKKNTEFYWDSKIDPISAFKYTLVSEMIRKYFPDKNLTQYKYNMEQYTNQISDGFKITIIPREQGMYQLTFILNNDFTLQSYHLEIPENIIPGLKERSLLGVHVKVNKLIIDVKYTAIDGHIYPNYYALTQAQHLWGKLLGTKFDQVDEDKSEFVVTAVNKSGGLKPFTKEETYKKGNICNNGILINDTLLKKYTTIVLSLKDSTQIKSLTN